MNTRVMSGLELVGHRKNVISQLEILHQKVTKNCLVLNDNLTHLATKMQAVSSVNWQDSVDQLVYNIIIDHCTRAERAGAGAFPVTLSMILESLQRKQLFTAKEDFQSIVDVSFTPTSDQLKEFLQKTIDDEFLGSLVVETLETSGLEGKIFFETSNNETVSIEQVNGFNFKVSYPFPVVLKEKDVKCLIVDGFVENVSEVHHLLQAFSDSKETLLFVARGFANDVSNTLKVNWDRGTLRVIPISVKFDFDGVNTLGDIATICCSDVVNSTKGQLISTVKKEEIKTVPLASCSGEMLTIFNDKAVPIAAIQVRKLTEKRREAAIEDLSNLYDVRIKTLTPCCTKVRVPSGRRFAEYSERFDVALRLVHSAIKRGLVSKDRLPSTPVFNHFPAVMTVESAIASLRFTNSCLRLIADVNTIIV